MSNERTGDVIYQNPLQQETDVNDWIAEGEPVVSFPMNAMRLENGIDPQHGQAANYLFGARKKCLLI